MDTQEAQDTLIAAFAEECAYDSLDPEREVQRLINNVTSAFWSTYNSIEPDGDDQTDLPEWPTEWDDDEGEE